MTSRTPAATSQRIRSRRLEDGDANAGLAVDAADLLVVERAELDARDILQVDDGAIGIRAQDDLRELLGRLVSRPGDRTV